MDYSLSDEEIAAALSSESLRGPRTFRGRPLAPLTRGLRALRNKVVDPDDTQEFDDTALLHILAEAHADKPAEELLKRRALILATDDVPTFRAQLSLLQDSLTDADEREAHQLVDEILSAIQQAEVKIVGTQKKTDAAPAEPLPTPTPSTSSDSAASPA